MSDSIDDTAIRWAVRLDASKLDADQQRALDAWLDQDARHRGALFRAQAGLALIDMADAENEVPSIAPSSTDTPTKRSRVGARGAMTAGAIAASFAGLLALSWTLFTGQHYRTEIGEIRRIALSDGSVALVNSGSDLHVRYETATRQLRLDEGEAWFQVAKNPGRPFVVDVGGVHVRATGTAFSVRRRNGAVEVVVTEGAVRAWRDGQPQDAVSVSAGNIALIGTTAHAAKAKVASAGFRDTLAWRHGGVSLNETTVFEAAQEFNRYNFVQIEIADVRIGSQLMTGYFQIDRPEEFSRAVSTITGAVISNNGNKFIIK